MTGEVTLCLDRNAASLRLNPTPVTVPQPVAREARCRLFESGGIWIFRRLASPIAQGYRRVTEVDDQRYAGESHRFEAGVVDGRFTIATQRWQIRWVAIVEPDVEASLLVVVTVYEVPQ